MADSVEKSFINFDDDNPFNQNVEIQICLYKIEEKLNAIKNQKVVNENGLKQEQIRYLMLCGFVWDMYDKIKSLGHNSNNGKFKDILEKQLKDLHIKKDGGLLVVQQSDLTPANCFDSIKSEHQDLFAMQPKSFKSLLPQLYDNEKEKISTNGNNDILTKSCKHVVQSMDKIINEQTKQGHHTNYQHYLDAAKVLNRLHNHPGNIKYQNQVNELVNQEPGQPSLNKKIIGGLTAALGVATIIGSVALIGLTLGGSTLPSAFGIALGVSLLGSEITLGTIGAAGSIIGSGLTFFGVRRNQQGQRQGLSNDFMEVEKAATILKNR